MNPPLTWSERKFARACMHVGYAASVLVLWTYGRGWHRVGRICMAVMMWMQKRMIDAAMREAPWETQRLLDEAEIAREKIEAAESAAPPKETT